MKLIRRSSRSYARRAFTRTIPVTRTSERGSRAHRFAFRRPKGEEEQTDDFSTRTPRR